jgi:hypothetical protein
LQLAARSCPRPFTIILEESSVIQIPLRARPGRVPRSATTFRTRRPSAPATFICAVLAATPGGTAFAHGFAGKRFFPATLATEDPFVADELSLPTVSRTKTRASDGEPATVETSTSVDFTKRITPEFGVGLGASYLRLRPEGGETVQGADNFAANVKYQFHKNDEHESIASVGIDWDIGNTGAKRVGAESFSVLTPAVFFGKGFGELSEGMKYLRPFAITGTAGIAIPTRSSTTTVDDTGAETTERNPNVLNVGISVQYSLPYLQSSVKDMGLGEPFNRLIPIVEFSLEKPLDRGGGPTTGTVNPGILWIGRSMQLGIEAIIPVNDRSASTGVLAQVHFFLDDLFPSGIGKPMFRDRP